jgi:hypothetical protein
MTLLKKYRPMLASVQARDQLSSRGRAGSDHGSVRIS